MMANLKQAIFKVFCVSMHVAVLVLAEDDFITCIPPELRGVEQEIWDNLKDDDNKDGGYYLSHLISDQRYPNNPTVVSTLQDFAPPANVRDKYGQRMRAYFAPPKDGTYTFHATCDSECKLFLSTDENTAKKEQIIYLDQYHRTGYDEWNRYQEQTSVGKELRYKRLYYMEALHSEYVRDDHARFKVTLLQDGNTMQNLTNKYLIKYQPAGTMKQQSPPGSWTGWSACNVMCGTGEQTRSRTCKEPPTIESRVNLDVPLNERKKCSLQPCPDTTPIWNVTAVNFENANKITLKWSSSSFFVSAGYIQGYRIEYFAVKEGDYKVVNKVKNNLLLGPNTTEVTLKNLGTFTVYNITIAPIVASSYQNYSVQIEAETCKCPKFFKTDWFAYHPYSAQILNGQMKLGGILPEIISEMVQASCGICLESTETKVLFNESAVRLNKINRKDRRILDAALNRSFHIVFPVSLDYERKWYRGHRYVPLLEIPGIVLLTAKRSSLANTRMVVSSTFNCLPVLALFILLMFLSGIIIWFLECAVENKHFPTAFHNGVQEGIWWSFVTMTTVGYGDKVPLTFLGRVYAITWSLTGIVISGIVIASLTSSLTVSIINEQLQVEQGKTIAVLHNSPEQRIALILMQNVGEGKTFANISAMVSSLMTHEVDGILLDLYTASSRTDLLNDSWAVVSKVIPHKFTYGIVLGGDAAKLYKRFNDYVRNKQTSVMRILQRHEDNYRKNTNSTLHMTEEMSSQFLKSSHPLFWMILWAVGGTLATLLLIGSLWHITKTAKGRKQGSETARYNSASRQYRSTQIEVRRLMEEFHASIQTTCGELLTRHRKERLFVWKKHSKIKNKEIGIAWEDNSKSFQKL